VESRRDFKRARFTEYREAIRRIQAHGITVNACFVLGLDGHGPEVFDALYDFVREAAPYDVQITVPTPFPGTPLYRQMQREGRLIENEAWETCTLFDINIRPQGMSAADLRRGFHALTRRLYSDEFTRVRRTAFFRGLREELQRRRAA